MSVVWFLFLVSGEHYEINVPQHTYHSQLECTEGAKAELSKLKERMGIDPDKKLGAICVEGLTY